MGATRSPIGIFLRLVAVVTLASRAEIARAQAAPEACPERPAVLRALRALSAHDAHGALVAPDVELSIEDFGDTYRVSVNGRTRAYTDATRDCAERAQVAAVFAALVLSSPNAVDADSEPAPAPPAPPPPPPPAKPSDRAPPPAPTLHLRRWWFDAGAALAFAPGVAGPPIEPAVELGFAYVPRELGVALGLRLPAVPALLPAGDAQAHFVRYPVDLAARWAVHAAPFSGTLDAGAVLALLRLRQTGDGTPGTQDRVEAGLRVATRWQLEGFPIAPYLELFSEVIPLRYQLALEPTGVVAKTPGLWLGAALGVSAHFD